MRVLRYRPAFFSGFDDEEAEADTLEELLAIPWVHGWSTEKHFRRFSVSDNRLMAEMDEGWYVVAILNAEHLPAPDRSSWETKERCLCGADFTTRREFAEHVPHEDFGLSKWKPPPKPDA